MIGPDGDVEQVRQAGVAPINAPTGGAGALSHPLGVADLSRPHGIDLATDRLAGADLHAVLHQLRDAGSIADTVFFGQPAAIVTTFEDNRALLRDDDGVPGAPTYTLSTEQTIGHTFIDAHGDDHHALRALATPAFRSRAIERFDAEALADLAVEVLDRIIERGEADLMEEFALVVPYLAIARKLGVPPSSEDDTRRWALGLISGALSPDLAAAARAEFDAHLGEVLATRRAEPTSDVLSGLVTAERDGRRFTDDEIMSHVRLLFAVGASTTSHGIGNMLSSLLHRPEVFERVVADPGLRHAAVREALRFEAPVAILPRVLMKETALLGRTLPAMSFLLVGIAAGNHDPAMFDEADEYRLDRDNPEVLTFGHGVKFCPGSHLAVRELSVALDAVAGRLSGLRFTDTTGSLPVGGPLRAPEHLHVAWDVA